MLASAEIRRAFPHLAQCVYLNTASAGLSWAGQGAAAARFYDDDKSRGIGGQAQWAARTDQVRQQLAQLLKVPAARVQFAGSTTEALNLIALAMPLTANDTVVLAEDEFPSLIMPWQALNGRGVRLHRVPIGCESQRTELLCDAIDAHTRVVAVSHVHWRTGTRVDLAQLAAACRRFQCRLIVDGVQALGAIPVDAGMTDAYCASVFKYLLGGFGLAVMVLSERFSETLVPAVLGYSNPPPSHALRYGHLNYPAIYALSATLSYLDSLGWEDIYRQVAALAARTLRDLTSHGFDVVTPHNAHAAIVSIRHGHPAALVEALARCSISVEDGSPYVRVSPHFYNTDADVDRLMDALKHSA